MKKRESPYPIAFVARLPVPHGDQYSAVLIPRHLGWLAVKVFFHRQPTSGLDVDFYSVDDDGNPEELIGSRQTTDRHGVASLPYQVPAGDYLCEIEGQDPTMITTVPSPDRPFPIPLPVGRPYFDLYEAPEFDMDARGPEESGQ